ncbi:MAG: glycosyltransferase family 4 protein [Bacteroidia bacterium]|jgi:glycosyltransferase involved in cell wall biosynthesis|nr:glycosyltransferase family 4 protein [Bacteroidia bacterium]
MKKVLFLYTEIAGYTLACLRALAQTGAEVHLVRWPVNQEAPFNFDFGDKLQVYSRRELGDEQLIALAARISPHAIVCSGWVDKGYVAVCRKWKPKIPVVLAMDNKWTGSMRQQLARLAAPFKVKRNFNRVWVPGPLQAAFARKLGFAAAHISTGFYSADVPVFAALETQQRAAKQASFPHRFVYTGRYYEFKGLPELWRAFIRLRQTGCQWELWCAGTGDLAPVQHEGIKHLGFVQPAELGRLMSETGVFVMPSRTEPWGVVLHEFAAAGFPVLCSREVGAASAFVSEGVNGYLYEAGNEEALFRLLQKMTTLSDAQLLEMGAQSAAKAQQITPQRWAETLQRIITNHGY